jgi:hypothetical protein
LEVLVLQELGALSTTRTCDLLVRRVKKEVNRGQREAAALVFPKAMSRSRAVA